MGEAPAISVVMGVCNDADILPETLASVLAQTERDFEFIVVDDGSSDPRVGEILADVARRDARLRVVTKSNEGLTRALIDGCAAARGTYVARIAAGDVMAPDRLARQRRCATPIRTSSWSLLDRVLRARLGTAVCERGAATWPRPDVWIAPASSPRPKATC
jgi:glycosyltransferase involved in cell wall biosynthesis